MAPIPADEVSAAAAHNALLFPAKDGGSDERVIVGKTKHQLQDMLRSYKLPFTGNKPILEKRLSDFSAKYCADPDNCREWQRVPAQRTHKGPREDTKKAKVKLSDTRRANIIDTERVTERSKDNRTELDKWEMREWAKRTYARLPYRPPVPEQQSSTLYSVPAASVPAASQPGSTITSDVSVRLRALETQFASLSQSYRPSNAEDLRVRRESNQHGVGGRMDMEQTGLDSTMQNIDCNSHAQPLQVDMSLITTLDTQMNTVLSAPAGPDDKRPMTRHPSDRSLTFWDGTVFPVTGNELMQLNVPAMSFAKDIALLNEMWDDTPLFWKGTSVLRIRGQHIPIVYWRELFRGTGQWSAHKSAWTEWKFLVERYRRGSAADFWDEFSTPDGKRMSFTAILRRLREQRISRNTELARLARAEYGNRFSEVFSYNSTRTGGARVVMSREWDIAEEYKRLKGLAGITII